jgi:hypothetical protein
MTGRALMCLPASTSHHRLLHLCVLHISPDRRPSTSFYVRPSPNPETLTWGVAVTAGDNYQPTMWRRSHRNAHALHHAPSLVTRYCHPSVDPAVGSNADPVAVCTSSPGRCWS